jgi:adenylate cyclase
LTGVLFLKLQTGADPHPHALRDGQTLIIGRGFDCDVVINHDSVSRRHAQVVVSGDRATVSDLNSSNGLYRNGERIQEADLSPGDIVRFGSVEASIAEPPATREQPVLDGSAPAIQLEHTIYRRVGTVAKGAAAVVDANRVIRLLGEVARTLVASLLLGETLERVVDLLLAHIPADRAMLSMRESAAGDFVPAVTRLKPGSAGASTPFSISRTVADLVQRERVAILTADVRHDERFDAARSLFRDDVRSLMCAPLCGYGTETSIIGLLYVDISWNHQFSVGDLELFTALADYASVAVSQARLDARIKREARQRERLARYHSPAVVERVLQDDHSSEAMIGQERDVTILFADIVKFTTMVEDMAADAVVRILNQFFSSMTDIVFAHEGTVDKFIGDAILVVFGAPTAQADHALRAIETARGMQAAIEDLNAKQIAPRPLQIRVALHSGSAVAGDVGSAQRLEYTVVGDVVNTAARLQSEVAAPGEIILSRATLERAGRPLEVEAIGAVKVKGRTSTVEAFRLVTGGSPTA